MEDQTGSGGGWGGGGTVNRTVDESEDSWTGLGARGSWQHMAPSIVRCPRKVPGETVPSLSPSSTQQPTLAVGVARPRNPEPSPQSQILFLKLRIHHANFPCLDCSIDKRLFTLKT